ncbi:MAG: AmmeMemoRadiSam system radical SAM enzyme [Acholeplasmataceae bacterium]|nr:AmmeMemoRadiSam system radical SAM enzyme [Acholeplasmataceae bacterium]
MRVTCPVCMHHCQLEPDQVGICHARKNEQGNIVSINYGKITSLALDPIEKKPLARFYPKSFILSVGSFGCNLRCPFCQNFGISMAAEKEVGTKFISPSHLTEQAIELIQNGNIGVAFTYNEPLVGYEYVLDTSKLLHEAGLKSVVVTNGSVTTAIAELVLPHIDALNIDLKGFSEKYYKKLGGDLETTKKFITLAASQCHVELTTLIVPGENDTREEMAALSAWVARIDKDIPLHVSRFFPRYNMVNVDATPVSTIYALAYEARKNLQYVYTGNC